MASNADATAGTSKGWHDLKAVLAEEPGTRLMATYLGHADLGDEPPHRQGAGGLRPPTAVGCRHPVDPQGHPGDAARVRLGPCRAGGPADECLADHGHLHRDGGCAVSLGAAAAAAPGRGGPVRLCRGADRADADRGLRARWAAGLCRRHRAGVAAGLRAPLPPPPAPSDPVPCALCLALWAYAYNLARWLDQE